VPEHRNAIPVALIVTDGRLQFDDGEQSGAVGPGEMLLINPGERHTYHAEVATSAYLVFAGLPGVRSRMWTLRRKAEFSS
jgi:quercetin dioxygenase-like cupin family protein